MKKLEEIVGDAKTVGITGHIRADGDCVGACAALYSYIRKNLPDVDVRAYLEYVDPNYLMIENVDRISTAGYDGSVLDLCIAVDSAALERTGENRPYFDRARRTACIDHHVSNTGFADYNYILPSASSACEALYGLMDDEKIDLATAEALYLGIAHDSGCFRFATTTPETLAIASGLMKKGVRFTEILEETYYKKTYAQQQITGRILLESIRFMENRCIFAYATKKMLDFYGVTTNDLDAVVGQLRNVDGVECAIFMYEIGEMKYKVSLRSKKYVDVSRIAVLFGGGGHVHAAGFDIVGTPHDIVNNVSKEIEKQMPPVS